MRDHEEDRTPMTRTELAMMGHADTPGLITPDEVWLWLWNIDLTATGVPHPVAAMPGAIRPIPDLPPMRFAPPRNQVTWAVPIGSLSARGVIIADRAGVVRGLYDFSGPLVACGKNVTFTVTFPDYFWADNGHDMACAKVPDVNGWFAS